jgi:hypothetical protein
MKSAPGLILLGLALGVAANRSVMARAVDGAAKEKAKVEQAGSKRVSGPAGRSEVTKTISGTVVDEAGAPVGNALVGEVSESFKRGEVAKSDAAGHFSLEVPVASLAANLIAKADGGTRMGFGSWAAREKTEPLRIVVRKAREIAVGVTDASHRPVAGATVAVAARPQRGRVAVQFAPVQIVDQQQTDAGGKAILRVPPELALACVFAVKEDVGFDYFLYRRPPGQAPERLRLARDLQPVINLGERDERVTAQFKLPADDARPVNFVLGGVHRLRVKVVDDRRRTLAGIPIRLSGLERPDKGGPAELEGTDALEATTDEKGFAVYRIVPADVEPNLRCHAVFSAKAEYVFSEQVELDPAEKESYVRCVARRRAVLQVHVTYPDGRPAAGAEVSGHSRAFVREVITTWNALTDGDGMAWVMPTELDAYFTVSAQSGHFAAPLVAGIARVGAPRAPLHLVLRPATRVHGTLTLGKDRRPLANEYVCLTQRDDAYARIPEDQRLTRRPAPEPLAITHAGKTDEHGRFEYFAAPGRYYMDYDLPPRFAVVVSNSFFMTNMTLDEGVESFEVKNQTELEVNLHRDRPMVTPLDGRVVQAADRRKGVPAALIRAEADDPRARTRMGIIQSGANGAFHAERGPCEMLLEAQMQDHTLAGIVRVGADDTKVDIPVGPAVTAHGRLVDRSGKPVVGQFLVYGIRLDVPKLGFAVALRQHAGTNRKGEFKLVGLSPGWKFDYYAEISPPGTVRSKLAHLGTVSPQKAEPIELHDVPLSVD